MSERKNRHRKIGWYVLAILGPAAPIGMVVVLFFGLYSAAPELPIFLILAILGILVYALLAFFLVRAVFRAGNPKYKSDSAGVSLDDDSPGPGLSAGIIGLALIHGLFGGRK